MSQTRSVSLNLKAVSNLAVDEKEALRLLVAAVYPPEAIATSPGRHITWSSPQWSLLVSDNSREIVSHIGITIRKAILNGTSVCIGGIGGVMTSPKARRQGYITAALGYARGFFDENGVAFALLVCRQELVSFYTRLGWQSFNGTLLVEQPGGTVSFTANKPMVLSVREQAPRDGTIHLCGLPW